MSGASPDPAVHDQLTAAARVPANHPVVVHCGSGNRAAAVWFAKRLVVDGRTVERASEATNALGLRNATRKQCALDYAKAYAGK